MNSLQHAIKNFSGHCEFEKSLSTKTMKAYKTDLKQFLFFFIYNNYNTDLNSITKIELRNYLEPISQLKPKTIKRKIATLKSLFNYLEFDDMILLNPFRKMKISIKEPKKLPSVMTNNEVKNILKTAYNRLNLITNQNSYKYIESIRNVVVIEILFATGARVSEIANLRISDINLQTGSILIKGKGNKERLIQICNKESLYILKLYLKIQKREIGIQEYFFINRLGNKISDQSIRNFIKNISKESGILRPITPHVFRHSFATLLLEQDVDIKYIQLLLGHSSIVTTQIYTHVNQLKQRQLLKSKHPRMNMLIANFQFE